MAEKSTEAVIDSWFYPAPVRGANGEILTAPQEAINKTVELKEKWLPLVVTGKREKPLVKLTPVYDKENPGWKVETAVRTKPNTTANRTPFKNN